MDGLTQREPEDLEQLRGVPAGDSGVPADGAVGGVTHRDPEGHAELTEKIPGDDLGSAGLPDDMGDPYNRAGDPR